MAGLVHELPDGWGSAPYLLMAHARATVRQRWQERDALVVAIDGHRGTGLIGLGGSGDVARLLDQAVADLSVGASGPPAELTWATVPRGTWGSVAPTTLTGLASWTGPSAWDCMWTYRPLVASATHRVERLAPEDPVVRAEVADALARAHPSASTSPEDTRLTGWWGIRHDGRLVAVVGALRYAPGLAPHLVSLGVDPAHRGRGLAGAVLGAAVRDGLAAGAEFGPPAVWLGLYASNAVARRVYLRLGFELGHEFESRHRPV